ncbi:MAG: flagellar basal-body rod protein FlgF [Gammaproteobacteria bacterium]|nr:flagellar basal-body rod protein FlgF [Gammaproteobacteria bacterium]NVK88392.1 flagellar basal-body rod protein FlgF [Gammaproteobacteria bacterium]
MDKMVYLAMSGAKENMLAQAKTANNLANANTVGFRADLHQARAMQAFGDGHPSRVFSLTERPGYRFDSGSIMTTGNDFDVAVEGNGWIAVQGENGAESYTRRGDLKISPNGLLQNGAGHLILGNGGPIAIPPFDKIEIGNDGTITIRPQGAPATENLVIDRIKLVSPNNADLMKNAEGLFTRKDNGIEPPNAEVTMVTKALEASNVNAVEEMINMISLSRQFEMQIKMMKTAEETDQAAEQLARIS